VSDLPVRVLAVLGAAALGAFGTGGLVKLVARLTWTRQKLPPWVLRGLRLLGAVTLGWLAALWMFGGGFGGFGGPGGWGLGPGAGLGEGGKAGSAAVAPKDKEKEKGKISEPGPEPVDAADSLQVEVLGADALRRLEAAKGSDFERRYRVDVGKGPQFLMLAELKDYLRTRQKGPRPLRQLNIVLYQDSPAEDKPQVADLWQWVREDLPPHAKGEKILVNIDRRGQNAPAK
jgi:hypothetical protein